MPLVAHRQTVIVQLAPVGITLRDTGVGEHHREQHEGRFLRMGPPTERRAVGNQSIVPLLQVLDAPVVGRCRIHGIVTGHGQGGAVRTDIGSVIQAGSGKIPVRKAEVIVFPTRGSHTGAADILKILLQAPLLDFTRFGIPLRVGAVFLHQRNVFLVAIMYPNDDFGYIALQLRIPHLAGAVRVNHPVRDEAIHPELFLFGRFFVGIGICGDMAHAIGRTAVGRIVLEQFVIGGLQGQQTGKVGRCHSGGGMRIVGSDVNVVGNAGTVTGFGPVVMQQDVLSAGESGFGIVRQQMVRLEPGGGVSGGTLFHENIQRTDIRFPEGFHGGYGFCGLHGTVVIVLGLCFPGKCVRSRVQQRCLQENTRGVLPFRVGRQFLRAGTKQQCQHSHEPDMEFSCHHYHLVPTHQ